MSLTEPDSSRQPNIIYKQMRLFPRSAPFDCCVALRSDSPTVAPRTAGPLFKLIPTRVATIDVIKMFFCLDLSCYSKVILHTNASGFLKCVAAKWVCEMVLQTVARLAKRVTYFKASRTRLFILNTPIRTTSCSICQSFFMASERFGASDISLPSATSSTVSSTVSSESNEKRLSLRFFLSLCSASSENESLAELSQESS